MADTRLQLVLRRIIHLRSARLSALKPTGRQAMDRPVPQVGSISARRVEFDMRRSPLAKKVAWSDIRAPSGGTVVTRSERLAEGAGNVWCWIIGTRVSLVG